MSNLVFKGEVPTEHGEEDDATAPNIDLDADVKFACDHLGGSVARTATSSLEQLIRAVEVGETEVNDLDVVGLIKQ